MIRRISIPVLFVVVALLFFRGSVFHGRVEIPCNTNRWQPWAASVSPEELRRPVVNTDCALAYYPRRVFATERMRAGDLPLWDPYNFSGQPFLANFQSAVLYPVNLVLYGMDPKSAMGWFLVFHFALAGFLAYRLARAFGMPRAPAVAAALVFELNPFFTTRVGHPTFVATGAWAPLVLLAGYRVLRSPGLSKVPLLAAAVALATLAGFPQTLIHIFYALFWLVLCEYTLGEGRRKGRAVLLAGAGVFLGGAIAAFQVLPTAEFLRHSTREFLDLPSFLSGTHHPAMSIKMVVPDFFGNPMQENLWSTLFSRGNGLLQQNYVSTVNYFGVVPLIVGIYGVFAGRKRLFLGGLLLFGLLVLWGTPAAQAAWHLPGFRYSRPDRLILLPLLATSIGFGFGLARLAAPKKRVAPHLWILTLFFLVASSAIAVFRDPLVLFFSRGTMLPEEVSHTVLRSALTTAAAAALFLLLLLSRRRIGPTPFVWGAILVATIDLFLFGQRIHLDLPRDSVFPATAEVERIREQIGPFGRMARYGPGGMTLMPPSSASLFGICDVAGLNTLNLELYRELMERVEPGLHGNRRYLPLNRVDNASSPILRLLGARVFTQDGEGEIVTVPAAPLPKASLYYTWESLGPKKTLWRMGRPGFDPTVNLLIQGEALPPPPAEGKGSAEIETYEPDRVVVRVETNAPAFLLLTDIVYPGWEVRVDGEKERLYPAYYAFRGVPVPEGRHVVDFRYRPASFRYGVALSAAALALFALLAWVGRKRRSS